MVVSSVFYKLVYAHTSLLISSKQASGLDENEVLVQITKAEQVKRSAEGSPENVPSRKRAAFGDITNVSLAVVKMSIFSLNYKET